MKDLSAWERDWMEWFRKNEPFFPLLTWKPMMPGDRILRPDAFRFRLFRWLP